MNKLATKNQLIRLYHVLAGKLNMSGDARMAVLTAFGVESSKDLTIDQLQEVCKLLKQQLNSDSDKWRKRVLASIYGYLQLTGRGANTDYVKSIAIRSAGEYDSFNQIPVGKLQTIYYAFLEKQKVLKRTGELMNEDLDLIQFKN